MNINQELALEKELIKDEDMTKYGELVDKYKYLLEYYINSKIDLSKYEDLINNSNLSIGNNDKYKVINKYLNLNYIFLINRLYVEKLSKEDIELINTSFDKENISNELINLVERTYKDVIRDNFDKDKYEDMTYKVCYGPFIPSNMVDNDSLVFKIFYGKNTINLEDNDFIELHNKQLSFFNDLIDNIKKEVQDKLNIKCEVLLEKDIR